MRVEVKCFRIEILTEEINGYKGTIKFFVYLVQFELQYTFLNKVKKYDFQRIQKTT